jgi:hypothetical protein
MKAAAPTNQKNISDVLLALNNQKITLPASLLVMLMLLLLLLLLLLMIHVMWVPVTTPWGVGVVLVLRMEEMASRYEE